MLQHRRCAVFYASHKILQQFLMLQDTRLRIYQKPVAVKLGLKIQRTRENTDTALAPHLDITELRESVEKYRDVFTVDELGQWSP